jgi:hypothetical protein
MAPEETALEELSMGAVKPLTSPGRVWIKITACFEVVFDAEVTPEVMEQLDAGVDLKALQDVNSIEDSAFALLRHGGTCEMKWSRVRSAQ